jgi:putative transcriptional regulator
VASDSSTPKTSPELQGSLLLADPSLRDGTFARSVVLLAEHAPMDGAFGLILNQPTGDSVGDILPDDEFIALRQLAVHDGGPVARDQLTFSALWWSPKNGLRWALRISAAEAAVQAQRPGRIVRAFIGYSGWTPGQLENEIQQNSWIHTPPQPDLFGHIHDQSLWAALLGKISPLHRILAEAPDDPTLN